MNQTLELPEQVYADLLKAARASGVSPSEWIATRLPREQSAAPSGSEREAALERLYALSFDLGHPTGLNNEQIDRPERGATR